MDDNKVYIRTNGSVDENKTSSRALCATTAVLVISPNYNGFRTMIDLSKLDFATRCKFAENPDAENPIRIWFPVYDCLKIDISKNYEIVISHYVIKCTAGVIKYGYSSGLSCGCWGNSIPAGYYLKAKRGTKGELHCYDISSMDNQLNTCEIEHFICDDDSEIRAIDFSTNDNN